MRAGGDPVSERVTLLTLARDLGVSRATVSNAYNRPDQLSAALRQRILERAEELGFAGPDPSGRRLRRGRAGAVGVLIDQGLSHAFSDPTAVLDLDGLATELQRAGLGLLLHSGTGSRADAEGVAAAAVDAWVVRSLAQDEPAVAAVLRQRRPVVVLDQPELPGVPVVGIDDRAAVAEAVRHLLELGHREVAVLSLPLRADGFQGLVTERRLLHASYPVARRRVDAVASLLGAVGTGGPVVECSRSDIDTGALGAYQLLDVERPPTAILALSDQLALGAVRAAQEMGFAVPAALSVTGFDDGPAAASAVPALTTVGQPLRERGRVVGRLVLAALRGEEVVSPPALETSLVVRASTAAPRPPGPRGRG